MPGVEGGRAPMRIVARLHGYPPRHNAGAEWMVHSQLRALVERGHDVSVWLSRYTDDKADYDLDGVQVVPLQSRLDAASAIRRADVVVSHLENVPSMAPSRAATGSPWRWSVTTPTDRASVKWRPAVSLPSTTPSG